MRWYIMATEATNTSLSDKSPNISHLGVPKSLNTEIIKFQAPAWCIHTKTKKTRTQQLVSFLLDDGVSSWYLSLVLDS